MALPPGPDKSRKELLEWYNRDPLGMISTCFKAHGDIFTLDLGNFGHAPDVTFGGKWVFITKPEDIKTMFMASPKVLHPGEANKVFFGGHTQASGSIRIDEEKHRIRQRFLQPVFKGERLKEYADQMREITEENVRTWDTERPFSMLMEMQRITIHGNAAYHHTGNHLHSLWYYRVRNGNGTLFEIDED